MTQALAVKTTENNIYESLALRGDLSGLKPEDKTVYMQKLCESLGLNPFTQPFIPLKLNGKEILYASRGCTDQLASIHKLTREIIKTERIEDVFVATCKVSAADGRFDISTGAVTLGNLKGDALANALMKAETKAKRRATLSFCGLGFLDESELETIPRERFSPPTKAELTKPKTLSPKFEAIKPIVQTLNAKGDSIKWSPAKTNEYVRELFDDENLTVETLSNEQFEIFQGDLQGRLAELEEAEAVRNEADEVIEGTVD